MVYKQNEYKIESTKVCALDRKKNIEQKKKYTELNEESY